jgi:hypothetical protein
MVGVMAKLVASGVPRLATAAMIEPPDGDVEGERRVHGTR